jgi:two-component system sensor histidine kinase KdpD
MIPKAVRFGVSLAGTAAVTLVASQVFAVNGSTAGFAYLLYVLVIASTWGFAEAAVASIASMLTLNFFFLPPVGTFTIADPQNWVALFAFVTTALIASRLSTAAKRRATEAIERQQDLERLYTFGRSILLIEATSSVAKPLCSRLAETFNLTAVALFEPRTGEIYRAGPQDFDGMDSQLREAALQGTAFADPEKQRVITAVRLGAQPIASLALQGRRMSDSVLQSIANLVAIGLERARSQELAQEMEITRRSERLRTTLLDAMAHELKTPLTSIRAATSALLASADTKKENGNMLRIADQEAAHLQEIIDNALEMAQVDNDHIDLDLESSDLGETLRDTVASATSTNGDDRVSLSVEVGVPAFSFDRRLVRLAVKQLVDNAMKYSLSTSPVTVRLKRQDGFAVVEVADRGKGIPETEQARIFERFYRSPAVENLVPGSGLGLSIALRVAQAHGGDLSVRSQPGDTTFRLTLPLNAKETA